jgi:hypothetical protein
MSELYDELKSRLTFKESPNWDTYDKAEKVLVVLSQTTSAVLIVYRKVRGNAAGQAELSAAIKQLHDEVIAPIDLPGVGPMIESLIDNQLGAILGGIVAPIDAYLDEHLPNPAK